jgi:hypothetical protein
LTFDDLIPATNNAPPPPESAGLDFSDLIPKQESAIPMPPRRPVEFGGTPEPVVEEAPPAPPPPPPIKAPANVQAAIPGMTPDIAGVIPEAIPTAPTDSTVEGGGVGAEFGRAAKRSFTGGVSDAASGIDVVASVMGTSAPQSVRDFAEYTGKIAEDKSLQGKYGSFDTVKTASDFGHYLAEQLGSAAGGLGAFLGIDIAVGAGTTATTGNPVAGAAASTAAVFGMATLQGIGASNKALMADEEVQKLIADNKLTKDDINRLSIIPGIISGTVTTGMIKLAGAEGTVTQSIAKDIAKIIAKDPAIFAGGGGLQELTSQLAAKYATDGKNEVNLKKIMDAAVNSAFGGLLFSVPKAGGRALEGRGPEVVSERGPSVDQTAALKETPVEPVAPKEPAPEAAATEAAPAEAIPSAPVQVDAKGMAPDQAAAMEAMRSRIRSALGKEEPTETPAAAEPTTAAAEPTTAAAEPVAAPKAKPSKTPTVPESPETLAIQRQELESGDRPLVMYPKGTPAPEKQPDGMMRYRVNGDIYDYNPKKVKGKELSQRIRDNTIQELMGLGPFNKDQVAASVAKGSPETAVVERTPEGTETRSAASTVELTPKVKAVMEKNKAPKNMVAVEPVEKPIQERAAANAEPVKPEMTGLIKQRMAARTDALVKEGRPLNEAVFQAIDEFEKGTAPWIRGEQETAPVKPVTPAETKPAEPAQREVPKTDADNFRQNYNRNKGDLNGMRENPNLKQHAAYADWLGSLTDAQWKKIEPTFTGADNPFLIGFNMGMDPVANRARFEALLGEKPKGAAKPKQEGAAKPKEVVKETAKEPVTSESNARREPQVFVDNSAIERINAQKAIEAAKSDTDISRGNRGIAEGFDFTNRDNRARFMRQVTKELTKGADAASWAKDVAALPKLGRGKSMTPEYRAALEKAYAESLESVKAKEPKVTRDEAAKKATQERRQAAEERKATLSDGEMLDSIKDLTPTERVQLLKAWKDLNLSHAEKLEMVSIIAKQKSDLITEKTGVDKSALGSGAKGDTGELRNPKEIDYADSQELADRGEDQRAVSMADVGETTLNAKDLERANAQGEEYQEPTARERPTVQLGEGEGYSAVTGVKEGAVRVEKKRTFRRARGDDDTGRLHPEESDVVHSTTAAEAIRTMKLAELADPEQDINRGVVYKVMERVRKAIGDTEVLVVSQETMDRLNPNAKAGAVDGYYDLNKNHIVVSDRFFSDGKIDPQLMAHEGMHALVQQAIDTNSKLKSDIQKLLDITKKNAPEDAYGFKDVHEFISEAMSNPDFQNILMSTKVPPEMVKSLDLNTRTGSMWDALGQKIAEYVMRIRNITQPEHNMMSAIMRVVERADIAGEKSRAERAIERERYGDILDAIDNRLMSEGRGKGKSAEDSRKVMSELLKRGVPKEEAKMVVGILAEEMGGKFDTKAALGAIDKMYPRPEGAVAQAPKKSVGQIEKLSSTGEFVEKVKKALSDWQRPKEKLQEDIESLLGKELSENARFYDISRGEQARIVGKSRQAKVTITRDTEALYKEASKAGISPETLGDDLRAYGAEDRNKALFALDPKKAKDTGISTKDAQDRLAEVAADPVRQKMLDRLVELNKRYEDAKLGLYVESGILSKEQVDTLRKKYPKYVSYKGFADEAVRDAMKKDSGGMVGRDVLGDMVGKAKGRETKSDDPIHNAAMELRRSIQASERNKTTVALANAVREAGWKSHDEGPVYIAESINDKNIKTYDRARYDDRIVGFREDGKQKFLVFHDSQLAKSVMQMSPKQANEFISMASKVTNGMKTAWTHLSPEFLARHFLFRYPIEGALALKSLKKLGVDTSAMSFTKDSFAYVPDMYRYLQGKEVKDPKLAKYFKEMEDAGGFITGYAGNEHFNLRDRLTDITANKTTSIMDSAKNIWHTWETVIKSLDASQRAAAYVRAREAGLSPQRSSLIARDITVDFDKRGEATPVLNVWLPFGNVAIQTTKRLTQNLQDRNYRRAIYSTMAAFTAAELFNYAYGGTDKDGTPWLDKIPAYERNQNFIVMLPGSSEGKPNYVKIPLPYPLFFFKTAGDAAGSTLATAGGFGGKTTKAELITRMLHGAAETFTPLGHDVNNLSDLWVPAPLRFAEDIKTNRNWMGGAIHTERPKSNVPHAEQGYASTGEGYKKVASVLSKIGMDLYPEDIKYAVNHFGGAQLRLGTNIGKAIEGGSPTELPGVRVVAGSINSEMADRSRYKNIVGKADYPKEVIEAIEAKTKGQYVSPAMKEKIADAEKRSGMTARQIIEVNKVQSELRSMQRKGETINYPAFNAKALKKFNSVGIVGGIDQH